jgi:hypothetical protein
MTEDVLLSLWIRARWHLIVSQLAPTFLLIVTVGLLGTGLQSAPLLVRLAAVGILLASGILGALVQISAAGEALAIIEDLGDVDAPSALSLRIVASRPWIAVVRFVTPAIFVLVFVALLLALLLPTR